MESSLVTLDPHFSSGADDFPALLRRKGLLASATVTPTSVVATPQQKSWQPTEATTILAFKFSGGVLVAGDRRATAGNTVVYDRADKVLEIDRHSIMAIAGVPATAWEMARVLEHSFQYFRRTQLQEMSVDGKVRALSKLLRDNFGFVMQGVGVVVPILRPTLEIRNRKRASIFTTLWARNLKRPITLRPGQGHLRCVVFCITKTIGDRPRCKKRARTKRYRLPCAHWTRLRNPTHRRGAWIAAAKFIRLSKSSRAKASGLCPKAKSPPCSKKRLHDRRAVSLG